MASLSSWQSGHHSAASDAIRLGRLVDVETRGIGEKLLYSGERNCLVFGPNGSGKSMRLLVPNLLQSIGRSMFIVDPKGELAAITAPFRRRLGPVVIINPFGVLTDRVGFEDLRSDGFNPLLSLDPGDTSFNAKASLLAEALIVVESKTEPHFEESARALAAMCIMHTVIEAQHFGTVPSMARVRELLCMPSEEPSTKNNFRGDGIPRLALSLVNSPIIGLRNKAAQFTEWNREKVGIASSAMRHTEPFDDPEIAEDLARGSFDFAEMKRRPCTVYLILPPDMMERHARWMRLILTTALQAVMRAREPGEPRVLFMIDEFAALGHLSIIETVWALVRGYGVQIMPVFQDLNQLKKIYGDRWETFIGNAGAVASFAVNDRTTAEWLSWRAGERTEVVYSYNTNQSENWGTPLGGSNSPQSFGNVGRDAGYHPGTGQGYSVSKSLSYQQTKVPLLPAHKLFGLGQGFGLVTLAGLSDVVPAFFPYYRNIAECAARARVNPLQEPVPRRAVAQDSVTGWGMSVVPGLTVRYD